MQLFLSLQIIKLIDLNISPFVLPPLFGFVLKHCVAEDSQSNIHRLYLCLHVFQGFFDLDNGRAVGHCH